MLYLLFLVFLLIVSFYFLIKSSDYLILSATILGKRAGFSKTIIGLTIIAVGTSLPELASALMGVVTSDNPAPFVFGTILGSNISNVLLVFSILLIFSSRFVADIKKEDIVMLVISTMLLGILVLIGQLDCLLGILFLVLFIVHILITLKKTTKTEIVGEVKEEEEKGSQLSNALLIWILLASLIVLNFAAKGVIECIERLGVLLEISLEYLTLTTVALATSLPEAVVTYVSAKKKEFDVAVGNIVGSNIANILLICGASSLVKMIIFDTAAYLLSLIIVVISTVYLVWIIRKDKVEPWYGIVGLFFYILYLIVLFIA